MFVLLTAIAVFVIGGGAFLYFYIFGTYHYLAVDPGNLYRDGIRSMREFETAVADCQPATVVSLCDAAEYRDEKPLQDEVNFIARTRMSYMNIPVPLGGYPDTKQVQDFLNLFDPNRKKKTPILVHCAQGIRRTGMMVAAYQMSKLNFSKDQAKAAIQAFGHSDRTINDIKRFIDVYDPVTREVTQNLPRGKEGSISKKEED